MEAGEILEEEEEVTPEEEEVTPEEGEVEIQPLPMTNFQDNNPQFLKEIDGNRKHLCRNGASTRASIDSPRK